MIWADHFFAFHQGQVLCSSTIIELPLVSNPVSASRRGLSNIAVKKSNHSFREWVSVRKYANGDDSDSDPYPPIVPVAPLIDRTECDTI